MLVVGSDCSGLCTESHALDALGTLMGYTVYTVYSGTVYFVQIVYFRTSKMHTCPLRVSVHCVLCIAYSAANLYSHLKKGLCTWERLCIAYCVLCIGGSTLGAVVYCVLRIVYCVLCIGGSALGAVAYCVLRIVYCVSEAPLWERFFVSGPPTRSVSRSQVSRITHHSLG